MPAGAGSRGSRVPATAGRDRRSCRLAGAEGRPQTAATAKRRLLRDFDRSPELVEAKPLASSARLLPRNVYDQRALVLGITKKSNRILPCGVSSPVWMAAPARTWSTLLVTSPCRNLCESAPASLGGPVFEQRRMAMAHSRPSATKASEIYGSGRSPARARALPETFDLLLKGGTVVNHAGEGVVDIGVRDGRIASIGGDRQGPRG